VIPYNEYRVQRDKIEVDSKQACVRINIGDTSGPSSTLRSYVSFSAAGAAAGASFFALAVFLDEAGFLAADLDAGLAAVLDAGLALATDFGLAFAAVAFAFGLSVAAFLGAAFFGAAFLAVAVVVFFAAGFLAVAGFFPTTAFFAGARFEAAVVFFAGAALVLPARTFLGAAGFFAAGLVAVTVFAFGLVLAAAGLGLVAVVFAAVEVLALDTGLEFSIAASSRTLGVSLTLPEGPLGSTKVPRSLPDVIARLSWLAVVGFKSTLYFDSTNFLIMGRETPPRASSGWAMMHSFIMSIHEGWVWVLLLDALEALVEPLAEDFLGAVGIGTYELWRG